jgi:hypothetical protein
MNIIKANLQEWGAFLKQQYFKLRVWPEQNDETPTIEIFITTLSVRNNEVVDILRMLKLLEYLLL